MPLLTELGFNSVSVLQRCRAYGATVSLCLCASVVKGYVRFALHHHRARRWGERPREPSPSVELLSHFPNFSSPAPAGEGHRLVSSLAPPSVMLRPFLLQPCLAHGQPPYRAEIIRGWNGQPETKKTRGDVGRK